MQSFNSPLNIIAIGIFADKEELSEMESSDKIDDD